MRVSWKEEKSQATREASKELRRPSKQGFVWCIQVHSRGSYPLPGAASSPVSAEA